MKHKGIDYKTSAFQYYLNNNESMDKVCKIFNCKKTTLKVWVHNYKNNRKPISYKVKKEQLKSALGIIDRNEQLTMGELLFEMKNKYEDFDITIQHLGIVVHINNKTRKNKETSTFSKI